MEVCISISVLVGDLTAGALIGVIEENYEVYQLGF